MTTSEKPAWWTTTWFATLVLVVVPLCTSAAGAFLVWDASPRGDERVETATVTAVDRPRLITSNDHSRRKANLYVDYRTEAGESGSLRVRKYGILWWPSEGETLHVFERDGEVRAQEARWTMNRVLMMGGGLAVAGLFGGLALRRRRQGRSTSEWLPTD